MPNAVRKTTREERLSQALAEREAELKLLLETSQALNIEFDVDQLLQIIADRVLTFTNTRSVLIPILNPACDEYTYRAGSGEYSEEVLGERLPINYGVCGWIWRNKQPWWRGTVQSLPKAERLHWEKQPQNMVMVPLIGKKHFLGGIACMNKRDGTAFNQRDLELLMLFANQAAIAVENAMLYAKLQELNNSLEKRVEQRTIELQQINREMEGFSYSISHDLRAPLRSILGFSEAIVEDFAQSLPAEACDYLQRVSHSAEKMQNLIEALLKLTHLRRNPINKEYLDLSAMVSEIVQEIRSQAADRTIDLIMDDDISALGDPTLIWDALYNLIGNAVKFTRQDQAVQITFRTQTQPDGQVYCIGDNGVGFDVANAERLFSPFQRFHSEAEFTGTGIGLASVAQIIQRHGGRIWAESTPGQGSCFYFTLGY